MRIAIALALLSLPLAALAQDFQQGPEQVGRIQALAGRVQGLQGDCALVIADRGRGRFFYCAPGLSVGQQLQVDAVQVNTRRAKVGPRWRTLPVYRPQ